LIKIKKKNKPKFAVAFGAHQKKTLSKIMTRPEIKFKNTEIEEDDDADDEDEKELDKIIEETDWRNEFILSQPPSDREIYLRDQYLQATTHPQEFKEKMTQELKRQDELNKLESAHGQYYPLVFSKLKADQIKKYDEYEKYDYPALHYEKTGELIPPAGLTTKQRKEWFANQERLARRQKQIGKEMEKLKETNPELYQRLLATYEQESVPP